MPFNMPEEKPRSDAAIESIIEGKKMEAYAEHRTKDMHSCAFCGAIGYRKRAMRPVGAKWICIDCLRSLKETLEGLDQWEAEIQLEKEMSKKIDQTLRT
jgi:ribosomal protein L37AE/L43A